jgi:hypothetical protein
MILMSIQSWSDSELIQEIDEILQSEIVSETYSAEETRDLILDISRIVIEEMEAEQDRLIHESVQIATMKLLGELEKTKNDLIYFSIGAGAAGVITGLIVGIIAGGN